MIFCALKCEDSESAYGLAMHVITMWQYLYSCTSESSCAISHDTITFTHVPRVLHFSAFLSHNLPYALSLTPSTVQKTINSHSTAVIHAMHLLQLYRHRITVRVFCIHSLHPAICSWVAPVLQECITFN